MGLYTDRQTVRQTDRLTYRCRGGESGRQTDRHTYLESQRDRNIQKGTDRQTDIQTYRHTDIQTDRQTDRGQRECKQDNTISIINKHDADKHSQKPLFRCNQTLSILISTT